MYLSFDEDFAEFSSNDALLWEEQDLSYDWEERNERSKSITLAVDDRLLSNQTAFVHVYVTRKGVSPNPDHNSYDYHGVIYRRHRE